MLDWTYINSQGYRIRVSLCNFKANRSNVSLAILELQNRSCLSDDSKENINKNTFIDSKCFGLIILQYIFYGSNRKISTSFFTPCPLILLIRSTVRRRRNRVLAFPARISERGRRYLSSFVRRRRTFFLLALFISRVMNRLLVPRNYEIENLYWRV